TVTWSSRPVCARPVRTLARSALSTSMDFCIFCSVVLFRSEIIVESSGMNERALVLAHHHALERAGLEDREHVDRQFLVATQREGGRVEYFKVPPAGLIEADAMKALGVRILLRVGGVDAVALGRLEHKLRAHFRAAQRCRGIGGEERVA